MPTAWPTIQPIVKLLVSDKAGKLTDYADYDTLIAQAVKGRYSQDRPLVKAKEYTGDDDVFGFDEFFAQWRVERTVAFADDHHFLGDRGQLARRAQRQFLA